MVFYGLSQEYVQIIKRVNVFLILLNSCHIFNTQYATLERKSNETIRNLLYLIHVPTLLGESIDLFNP